MNFLQLCQRAATECGVSGTLATTAGQQGSLARVVNWIGDSWQELQTARDDWDWMRSSNLIIGGPPPLSFVPASGQYSTPLGTNPGDTGIPVDFHGKYDWSTFRCYTTATAIANGGVPIDETFLDCIGFDAWRDGYMFGAMRAVRTRPVVVAIGPDQSICLGPPPNGNYTITGDFWIAPTLLLNDADVPIGLPTRWHMLIVYKMMMTKYGFFEAAADVLQRGQTEWDIMYRQVEKARLPTMGFGGALA